MGNARDIVTRKVKSLQLRPKTGKGLALKGLCLGSDW
jgi:hypothetical protein